MKMHKPESIMYIPYKDYTSTSEISGFQDSSNKGDSVINIIKNNTYIIQFSTIKSTELETEE